MDIQIKKSGRYAARYQITADGKVVGDVGHFRGRGRHTRPWVVSVNGVYWRTDADGSKRPSTRGGGSVRLARRLSEASDIARVALEELERNPPPPRASDPGPDTDMADILSLLDAAGIPPGNLGTRLKDLLNFDKVNSLTSLANPPGWAVHLGGFSPDYHHGDMHPLVALAASRTMNGRKL
ncbi:MAG: hypothetical protein LCH79_16260 [Proteobacteria bacterium]|nr:hypothetical protein [Pseudomonadota bacterium]